MNDKGKRPKAKPVRSRRRPPSGNNHEFSMIGDISVVTIPADLYKELVDCRMRLLAEAAREAKRYAGRLH